MLSIQKPVFRSGRAGPLPSAAELGAVVQPLGFLMLGVWFVLYCVTQIMNFSGPLCGPFGSVVIQPWHVVILYRQFANQQVYKEAKAIG